ncbi:MAG: hypothetical protein AB7P76_09960 [Candidatus Melainabacteria bacterium]
MINFSRFNAFILALDTQRAASNTTDQNTAISNRLTTRANRFSALSDRFESNGMNGLASFFDTRSEFILGQRVPIYSGGTSGGGDLPGLPGNQ